MRTRSKEIDAIVEVLSAEHDSVDDLAKDVWNLIDQYRRERELWVVAVKYVNIGTMVFGPYESEATATKDLEGRGKLRGLKGEDAGRIYKLLSPSNSFVTESLHEQGILDFR